MISACLILTLAGSPPTLLPIESPFPSQKSCETAALSMIDGKTVREGLCVPLEVYDCRRKTGPSPIPLPKPAPKKPPHDERSA